MVTRHHSHNIFPVIPIVVVPIVVVSIVVVPIVVVPIVVVAIVVGCCCCRVVIVVVVVETMKGGKEDGVSNIDTKNNIQTLQQEPTTYCEGLTQLSYVYPCYHRWAPLGPILHGENSGAGQMQ